MRPPIIIGPWGAELLGRLGRQPDAGRLSDVDVVAAAYRRWGATTFGRLLGDFALVIWDPAERRWTGARDAMGMRPLYWHRAGTRVVFASEVAQITARPEVAVRG